jgi:rubrerythrin
MEHLKMKIKDEYKLGITKGTELEKKVQDHFNGETQEVGIYLAIARQASREGYGELAEVFKNIAREEAGHATRFAEMNSIIKPTLKENIEYMLNGEKLANKEKKAAADKAKENSLAEPYEFFSESSRDESRHAKILEGILKRYF